MAEKRLLTFDKGGIYAAIGPLPTSLGVTPSPTPSENVIDRRHYVPMQNINYPTSRVSHLTVKPPQPPPTSLQVPEQWSPNPSSRRASDTHFSTTKHKEHSKNRDINRSHQNLSHSGTLKPKSQQGQGRALEPIQLIQKYDSIEFTAARLRGSLQKLDSPIYKERNKWNNSNPSSTCTYDTQNSIYKNSSLNSEEEDPSIEAKCCFQSTCCKVCFSIAACIVILSGIMTAVFYFIKYRPFAVNQLIVGDRPDPCIDFECKYGSVCVPTLDNLEANCQCPEDCSSYTGYVFRGDATPDSISDTLGDRISSYYSKSVQGMYMKVPTSFRESRFSVNSKLKRDLSNKNILSDEFNEKDLHLSSQHSSDYSQNVKFNDELGFASTYSIDFAQPILDSTSSVVDLTKVNTICASDGRDYENECEMKKRSCRIGVNLTVKYIGLCDPCSELKCSARQTCVLGIDRRSSCRCTDNCNQDYDLVCASDGKTYKNACIMSFEGCKRRRMLSIIYKGKCNAEVNPCDTILCLLGEECNIDGFGTARCECPTPCESIVRPVCGSDGQTYDNACELRRTVCLRQKNITAVFSGVCGMNSPCSNFMCDFGAVCVDRGGQAACECPTCPQFLKPVCGSDGFSYDNECSLRSEMCRQRKQISVRYPEPCTGCDDKVCSNYGVCQAEIDKEGDCVCPHSCASQPASPVCGSNGLTYLNECALKADSCKKDQLIAVASRGDCDLCKHVICKYGARCESGECICPTTCHNTREPVCASNVVTYLNECEMEKASCLMGRTPLRVVFFGECAEAKSSGISGDPCSVMSCEFGSACIVLSDGIPRCTCTLDCSDSVKDPVCASDLKMYPNECAMYREACQRQIELRLRPLELCEDYELVPCNHNQPLVNYLTGRDYYCGEGPVKEECPEKSYCHWSLSFAKCCPLNDVILQEVPNPSVTGPPCSRGHFGCCPDGKSESYGPNYAGCPSICQCHKLGAYANTCDSITNQCHCKPGVGGTKCDRCEPGYWGLPQIQHGAKGCQPCSCSLFGSVRDDCEQMTGQCVCKPGIGGKKCNICPSDLVLGPRGCTSASKHPEISVHTCADLECYFGAKCHVREGHAECLCDAQCPADSSSATPVCGSDGETYGSECHLKLYACRYQKDVVIGSLGPCPRIRPGDVVTEVEALNSFARFSPFSQNSSNDSRNLDVKNTLRSKNLADMKNQIYVNENNFGDAKVGTTLENLVLQASINNLQISQKESTGQEIYSLLGSYCYRDKDCSVAYSFCQKNQCWCKEGYTTGQNMRACVGSAAQRTSYPPQSTSPCDNSPCQGESTCQPQSGGRFTCHCQAGTFGPLCEVNAENHYEVASFHGKSYMQVKKIKAYNKVQIEMEFRSFSRNGILLYSQQMENGSGDFISVAVVDGFVEFRYDLGSGPVFIRSHHKITTNKFHKISIKRFERDGMLQLDGDRGAKGQAPGYLKSLNLRGYTNIGWVKNGTARVWSNIGTSAGLSGCIRSIKINGRTVEIYPQSPHIITAEKITECEKSPCFESLCKNDGFCTVDETDGIKCECVENYSGDRCEKYESACQHNRCQHGGTCLNIANNFVCQCSVGRRGKFCEIADDLSQSWPVVQFYGDSYLKFPPLQNVKLSLSLEIWFRPESLNGLLLYNGQKRGVFRTLNSDGLTSDFIALYLRDGHAEFLFNLGSGITVLRSPEKIVLAIWQTIRLHRRQNKAVLQLGAGVHVRTETQAQHTQLNLDQPLFVGGISNFSGIAPEANITEGFVGAIQRMIFNDEIFGSEKITEKRNIKNYIGPPCDVARCENAGVCRPILNQFYCDCKKYFEGKFCQIDIRKKKEGDGRAIIFDGVTYMKFPITSFSRSKTNASNEQIFSDYWGYDEPMVWNDLDLQYSDVDESSERIDVPLDNFDQSRYRSRDSSRNFDQSRHRISRDLNKKKLEYKSYSNYAYKDEKRHKNKRNKRNSGSRYKTYIIRTETGDSKRQFYGNNINHFRNKFARKLQKNESFNKTLDNSKNSKEFRSYRTKNYQNDRVPYSALSSRKGAKKLRQKGKLDKKYVNNLPKKVSRESNQISLIFRASSGDGLILWSSDGDSSKGDFFAVALAGGFLQISFRTNRNSDPATLVSKIRVSDGKWHTATIFRRKKLSIIKIDSEDLVKKVFRLNLADGLQDTKSSSPDFRDSAQTKQPLVLNSKKNVNKNSNDKSNSIGSKSSKLDFEATIAENSASDTKLINRRNKIELNNSNFNNDIINNLNHRNKNNKYDQSDSSTYLKKINNNNNRSNKNNNDNNNTFNYNISQAMRENTNTIHTETHNNNSNNSNKFYQNNFESGTKIDVDNVLWVGGAPALPSGLPPSYYIGFKGCIKSIEFDGRFLDWNNNWDIYDLKYCL